MRSERLLMEELNDSLRFGWLVGLHRDDAVWHTTVYRQNRNRLLEADVAGKFFDGVVSEATQLGLMSDEQFAVGGSWLEACASWRAFRARREASRHRRTIRGTRRWISRERSGAIRRIHPRTDPDARLARKGNGKEAKLSDSGRVLMKNRHGRETDAEVLPANGTAERDAVHARRNCAMDGRATRHEGYAIRQKSASAWKRSSDG